MEVSTQLDGVVAILQGRSLQYPSNRRLVQPQGQKLYFVSLYSCEIGKLQVIYYEVFRKMIGLVADHF